MYCKVNNNKNMEIDSQQPLSDHISNIQSQISAIVNSGQNTKYSFLQKALHLLEELRDLMNDREIEEYVSLFLFCPNTLS